MASEKTVNYTEAQTAELVEAFKANATEATVKMFAERFDKSTRSIVAKLSREGVYVAKDKTKGEGAAKAATKADLVAQLESMFELDKGTLESLEKGSKAALEALVAAAKAEALAMA
jgi:hypothetical protein